MSAGGVAIVVTITIITTAGALSGLVLLPVWGYVALWFPGHKLGIQGPIPTMRLKGFRRGLQDYEHLALLTKLSKGDSSQADAILHKYYKSLEEEILERENPNEVVF